MNIQNLSRTALLAAGMTLVAVACRPDSSGPKPTDTAAATAAATAKHEPTAERALERARQRWAKIAQPQPDWYAAYEFLSPEAKRTSPLGQYLSNVQNHKYEDPKVLEVVHIEKGDAFVRTKMKWTPQHPQLSRVKLKPGESLTQDVEDIETWHWAEGDWCYQRAQLASEFFEAHPDFLKNDGPAATTTAPTKSSTTQDGTPKPK